jgi:hypothetical protein
VKTPATLAILMTDAILLGDIMLWLYYGLAIFCLTIFCW